MTGEEGLVQGRTRVAPFCFPEGSVTACKSIPALLPFFFLFTIVFVAIRSYATVRGRIRKCFGRLWGEQPRRVVGQIVAKKKNSNSISFPSEEIIARLLDYVYGEIVDRLANRGAKKILYATLYFRNYIYIDVKEHLKYVNLHCCYESYCVLSKNSNRILSYVTILLL